jgi:hypothetical protein
MVFFSRHLDFTAYAHPDEPSKIAQIVERRHNLHHPLLLLNSARAIAEATGRHGDFEFVKLAGRWCSVIFSSLGVALLVLACGRLHGALVAAAAGAFLISNPMVFGLAHYFKEDPALLFGIALALVAMLVFSSQRTAWAAVFLGLASACAASGKFVGALVVPFSVYIVWVCSAQRRRDLALLLAACTLGFFAVNLPLFTRPVTAAASLNRELNLLAGTMPGEVFVAVPHTVFAKFYWQTATPVLALLLVIYLYGLFVRRFRVPPVERVFLVLPSVYFVGLCWLSRPFDRYLLPAGALLACVSAMGLATVREFRGGRVLAVLFVAASLAWQVPRLLQSGRGFKQDHGTQVVDFLENRLGADSKVLADWLTGLPPSNRIPVSNTRINADVTLEELRREGFTHIVVNARNTDRFFRTNATTDPRSAGQLGKLKAFYESLFHRGILLKEWKVGDNTILAKPLKIYSMEHIPVDDQLATP